MNAMQVIASQPLVERLGWTLIHFLWQGLSISLLYATARSVARASSPQVRYLLACAALSAMMAAPLVTWELMRPSLAGPDAAYRVQSRPPDVSIGFATSAARLPTTVRAKVADVRAGQILPWVVMVWFVGALALWVRLIGGCVVAARMRSQHVRPAPQEWQETLRKLGERIGLFRPVQLLVSALVQVPTVVGWLRPVVLIPVGAFGGLPPEHLEALLLHELAHIRRHDYLVNILQSIIEALLFYHPAVWWVSGHIRSERELCCDDIAVSVSGNPLIYARALAQLESYRPAHLAPAVAANGGFLSNRIARLLGQPKPLAGAGLGPGAITVALLLVAAAYGLFGQSEAHPAFQTVSIKRNTSNWNERFQHGFGMGSNASLMLLIQFAYANHDNPMLGHSIPLSASQVVGGPAWINSEGYDIEAKPAAHTDPKQEWLMWQTLLADRFKLRLHRETRDLPIYILTAAKNGLKLPPAKKADCVSFPPGSTPRYVAGKVDCGYVSGPGFDKAGMRMQGSKVHMADLIRELALVLDRPVVDETGFAGEFDLNLTITPDGSETGASGPNILAALEEQLGLKLASSKGPVEVLVIDHAERPIAN